MASVFNEYLKAIGVKPAAVAGQASAEAAPVKRTSIYKTYLESVVTKKADASKIVESKPAEAAPVVEAAKVVETVPVVEAVKPAAQPEKVGYRCKFCGGTNHI
ncbi:MAG: hypothetical protein WCP55_02060 [Lentisphaerota bacterium]